MSDERTRWDERYRSGAAHASPEPSGFLRSRLDDLPPGRALDVACGDGRNALLLAELGLTVHGLDISREGLARAKSALRARGHRGEFVQCDLETYPLPPAHYDVVLNIRYLQRSLLPALKRTLRASGVIVFETFLLEQAATGHPKNPDFLLRRGELAEAFSDLDILVYEEGRVATEGDAAHLARMLARRPVGWSAD
jgi:SAM-dependent methyltransferase